MSNNTHNSQSDALSTHHYHELARQMIQLGGRPPTIGALLPITKPTLKKLYREITKTNPPTGPLPSSHTWYANTAVPSRVVQSTLLVSFYCKLKERSPSATEAELHISAYSEYLLHVKAISVEPLLSFDRAWHLLRELKTRNLITIPCNQCGSPFVVVNGDLHVGYVCPLCKRRHSLKQDQVRFSAEHTELID